MRTQEDTRLLCLRDLRVTSQGRKRAHLNVGALCRIIEGTSNTFETGPSPPKGKKRVALSTPGNGSLKRPRRGVPATEDSVARDAAGDDTTSTLEDGASFPVYRHRFNLQYIFPHSDAPSDDDHPALRGMHREEVRLRRCLEMKTSEPGQPIDFGKLVVIAEEQDSHLSVRLRGSLDTLLTLPRVDAGFILDDHDMRLPASKDFIWACYKLSTAGRASLSASLALEVFPPNPDQDSPMFSLHVDLTLCLLTPAIFEPTFHSSKSVFTEIEESQRRVLSHVFPDSSPPSGCNGAVDLPFVFSILGPAPSLYHTSLHEALQPVDLVPTLLPFQRRSVAWMLAREGKAMSPNGEVAPIVPFESGKLPLFWQQVEVYDDTPWYYHQLTGRVSRERPEDKNAAALGGILAEEPGLGKTLECISLVLLNPAIGRNPTIKTWDAQARLHVKEVKTTLIVTPPVLAPQWADEITRHAPHLKVLIYDGWSKVTVPVTEAEAEAAREAKVKTKQKQQARAARKKAAAAKSEGKKPAVVAKSSRATRANKRNGTNTLSQEALEDVVMQDVSNQIEDFGDEDEEIVDWCTYVNSFDVCITTYTVLHQDLSVARPPPERPRRAGIEYGITERSRSPLIMCEWYRVIMDEVQMVGAGKAEEMVALIPRLSSFAVSGTPARAQVADLIHAIKFLRVTDVVETPRAWVRLLKPHYVNQFVSLFQTYTIRTMKNSVKGELTIPRQTRFLLPIELGKVERHVYDHSLEQALLELGLDSRGVAVREDWEADVALLRAWLRKLRGICTHPQVGQLQNQADKLHKPGGLKSISEVLEDMRDKNWRNLMEDWRYKVQALTTLAQLMQNDNSDRAKYRSALDILLLAEKEATSLIAAVETAIKEHDTLGEALKAQTAESRKTSGFTPAGADKGKGRAESPLSDDSEEDGELPQNAIGREHSSKKGTLQQRLRECQISLHKVYFLKGDVCHALGGSHSEAEEAAYAGAEVLRRKLLSGTEEAAERAMNRLIRDSGKHSPTEKELHIEVPYCGKGGIRSAHLMEEANNLIDEVLNEQGKLIWRWRCHLVKLLTQPLNSNGQEADGQEYNRSLNTQGEAETYLQNYATLLADRREALNSERTLLAVHEGRETKHRGTKAAQKAAAAALEDPEAIPIEELDAQNQVVHMELSTERKAILEDFNSSRAVRSVMVDLNNLAASIANDQDLEKIIAKQGAQELRMLISNQMKLIEKLRSDCTLLRRAFNDRVSYFRQLQELSDTVAEATWEGSVGSAIAKARNERDDLDVKIKTGRARQRYLDNLSLAQGNGTDDDDDECCILCKCEFTRGYITHCAHVFCESCMKAWLTRKEGKSCPVCRVAIDPDQLQRFALAESEKIKAAAVPSRIVNNEPVPKSSRPVQYNMVEDSLLDSIHMMESHGSFGSKIQTLVQHLLYLDISDPGCKTIVFSAWADSLHIIEYALRQNGIKALRGDQNSGKRNAANIFRTSPEYSVLLLHGERENAGLNVTCASRVILVESVVNHAFEIQAIARIDRMGQMKPTEVYCYYAEDTVEKNILDLAAKRGQSLYTKDNAAGTLNVNPLTNQGDGTDVDAPSKKKQKGDFVFKTDDMLAILFPHLFEDFEYLVPQEGLGLATNTNQLGSGQPHTTRTNVHENAVAGPSRLR